MVRALDFYPGDPGSNPIRDVGFFHTMHHFLVTNFHISKTVHMNSSIHDYDHSKVMRLKTKNKTKLLPETSTKIAT